MAHTLPPFRSFDLRATDASNTGHEWTKWIERLENFVSACDITVDSRKKALLLHYVGEEVYNIFHSLPDSPTQVATATSTTQTTQSPSMPEYDAARAKLSAYFAPRVKSTFSIYKFRQAQQNVSEPLDAFYARLRQLSRHCNFENVDAEVQNQIILATTSSRLRKYAMLHSPPLPDLLKQGRMLEDVERDVSKIEKNVDSNAVVLAVHKHPVPETKMCARIDKVPNEYVNFIQRHNITKAFSAQEVADATKADQQLQSLISAIQHPMHTHQLGLS
ncbi:uncharacterized protein [Dermacentor andersoni]|uniref:uncharacterized protein n=1 Tax=Dermacentor andersoni TaxID=34620 RepID=UPI003B3BD245